jgi:eukaryotic-like serine/threonine-protein kinase
MRTVSHYELLEKIGEGGMGVVWKARDTRLGRFVAVKFLPPDFASNEERKRRFAQEARAASALNHPRITTIYDIDHADGSDFIVMEYVPGKTLDQLIPPKGMKILDAVRYAIQIADALSAAHAAGIVHRDLKPTNILVNETGQIKVLDFGLAKLSDDTPLTDLENTRTLVQQPKTEEGVIVGTVHYMSPEQAEGRKVDFRSDIFSFGALLYEMLSGRRPFSGDTRISTLAAILRADPEPLDKLIDSVPRELTRLVHRCLKKDPEERAQSMADLRIALKEIKEDSESGTAAALPVPPPARSGKGLRIAVVLGVLSAAAGAAYLLSSARTASSARMVATPFTSYEGIERTPTFSPDGNQIAFLWNGERQDNFDLYVKLLGTGAPLRLTNTPASESNPAWSPDGRLIAFVRDPSILLISPLGGQEREVWSGPPLAAPQAPILTPSAHWTPDGRSLVTSIYDPAKNSRVLYLISVDTGERRRLTSPPPNILGDLHGRISPDGQTLVFLRVVNTGSEITINADLFKVPLRTGYEPAAEAAPLTSDHSFIRGFTWTSDSRQVVFASYRDFAPALWRIQASGAAAPARLAVGASPNFPDIARQGNRLVFQETSDFDTNIWRIDLTAPTPRPEVLISSTRRDVSPHYSPDGRRIAFSSQRSGLSAIWVADADGANPVQLTTSGHSGSPCWSPDGQQLAFDRVSNGTWQIFTMSARGGAIRQLTQSQEAHTRPFWSHDGKWIYSGTPRGISKSAVDGSSTVQLTDIPASDPVESDDGTTVYFFIGEELWSVAKDGGAARRVVATPLLANGVAVAPNGLYCARYTQGKCQVEFLNLSTGRSSVLHKFEMRPYNNLSLSPNKRWLLYSKADRAPTSDLMIVDPFK